MKRHAFLALPILALLPHTVAQEPVYRDPGMKRMIQVAIVCRDIDATAKRWADFLGVDPPKITTTKPGNENKMMYRGKPSNGQVKLAFINLGQTTLELLQPVGGNSSWQEYLDKYGESVHHVAFQVEDLAKTIGAYKKLNMPVIHEGRYDDNSGAYYYIDSRSQLGSMVELLHSDKGK